jgi:anti-anti-sigma factor
VEVTDAEPAGGWAGDADLGVAETPYGAALTVRGELDAGNATEATTLMHRAVAGLAPGQALLIDLRELSFLAAAGVRVLLLAAQRCEAGAVRCYVLIGPAPAVRMVFDSLGPGFPARIAEDVAQLPLGMSS